MFSDKYRELLLDFGKGKTMVLSTSENNKVSSRMMSVVQIDGIFYFQTDITFNKYLLNRKSDNFQFWGTR